MNISDTKQRYLEAYKLLSEESTTLEKFESIRKLIFGLNPKVDKILNSCSETLSKIEKLQKGEVIELTAEGLPEDTEEEKKRKRAILLFIKNWKDLQSEVERVKNELESGDGQQSLEQKVQSGTKIVSFAKGPFGIITILAAFLVGIFIVVSNQSQTQINPQVVPAEAKPKTQVINFNDKKIPLSELTTGVGSECLTNNNPVSHYHAKDHQAARAIDGTLVSDPGECGFGKVDEVTILEI